MKTTTMILSAAALLTLAACTSDAAEDANPLPVYGAPGAADVEDVPADELEGKAPTSTTLPAAPGKTKAPPLPPPTKPPPSAPPPSAPPPEPAAPAVSNDPPAELTLPAECAGHMENEPNNQNPDPLPTRVCGYAASGDADRFVLDVREGNAFVLQLESPSQAPWADVSGTCIPERRLSVGERMRLEPKKNCTVHVNVFANTPAAYLLRRDK